ncbi:MAG: bifunctional metallophosphatase/5'-nucleotidase [Muribaculaceae bacterium]|nr:bifunctional metallophosphatase/5'-nucleotidase [Muribaculaceae bacterium]
MKSNIRTLLAAAAVGVGFLAACSRAEAPEKLVILHTNDTHSQIEPGADGLGGVMRRKAVIDSVRSAEKNVLLVDAGDAVQGTLYFYLYGGQVEQEVMNILGVDERILGNHEFDNGVDSLAAVLRLSDAEKLATNYNLENSPLAGMFSPYAIKEYGGKKIGIMGINLNPDGIIAKGNYDGVEFLPIVATANLTAEKLRSEEGVDAVIALTHIGYNPAGLVGDSVLAKNSRGIDVIIGGHSHDVIDPATEKGKARSRMTNLDGKPVLVVQTGKAGRNLGKIEINLDSLGLGAEPKYELIRIDSRFDGKTDPALVQALAPYKAGVDSLMHDWIGTTARALPADDPELLNFFADYTLQRGRDIAGKVDLSIVNKGGLRTDIPAGRFSKGHIINMVPFRNYIRVIEVKGSDLAEVFDVMARTAGNGISQNVSATYAGSGADARAKNVLIDGRPIDSARTYRVATIDYLANGGDYMTGLSRGKKIAQSATPVFDDLIFYFTEGAGKGKPLSADPTPRWKAE